MPLKQLLITRPDDMHLHLRDGLILESVISYTSKYFGRAVVMPNLLLYVQTEPDQGLKRDEITNKIGSIHYLILFGKRFVCCQIISST